MVPVSDKTLPLHTIGDFVEVFDIKSGEMREIERSEKSLGYGLIARAQWSPNKQYWGYLVFVPTRVLNRDHKFEFGYELQVQKVNHHWELARMKFNIGDLVTFKVPSRGTKFVGELCILIESSEFEYHGQRTKLWRVFHQNSSEYMENVLEAELEKPGE